MVGGGWGGGGGVRGEMEGKRKEVADNFTFV